MAHTPSADDARARFDAATAAHLHGPLTPEVVLEPIDAAGFNQHTQPLWARDDARTQPLELAQLMTEDERAMTSDLEAALGAPLEHRVVLRAGDEIVGGYWGVQQSWGRYYMVQSVMRRDWQRRGLYRALLPRVIATATAAGFREIASRHRADNNAVIIPKLKAGFAIAGLEVTPRFGMLLHLRYYPSAALRAAFEHRIDGSHADTLRGHGLTVP